MIKIMSVIMLMLYPVHKEEIIMTYAVHRTCILANEHPCSSVDNAIL